MTVGSGRAEVKSFLAVDRAPSYASARKHFRGEHICKVYKLPT